MVTMGVCEVVLVVGVLVVVVVRFGVGDEVVDPEREREAAVGDVVGEPVGVVRGLERETVVGETRGSPALVALGSGSVDPLASEPSALGVWSAESTAALLGSMNRNTPTAVAPPIQTRTRLGSGFQLPPLVTEWRWRPSSRT
jgi:hypothetical protein